MLLEIGTYSVVVELDGFCVVFSAAELDGFCGSVPVAELDGTFVSPDCELFDESFCDVELSELSGVVPSVEACEELEMLDSESLLPKTVAVSLSSIAEMLDSSFEQLTQMAPATSVVNI